MDRVARPRRIDVPPRTRWPAEPGACPRKLVDSHMDRTRDTAVDGERRGAGGLPLRYCTDPLSRPAGPPLPCTVVSTVVRKLVGSVRRTRPPREFCQNHGQNSHPVSFILAFMHDARPRPAYCAGLACAGGFLLVPETHTQKPCITASACLLPASNDVDGVRGRGHVLDKKRKAAQSADYARQDRS